MLVIGFSAFYYEMLKKLYNECPYTYQLYSINSKILLYLPIISLSTSISWSIFFIFWGVGRDAIQSELHTS